MSLSDGDTQEFRQLSVNSLENFEDEVFVRNEDQDPDFDRFKLLFEKEEFAGQEDYEFKAVYDVIKQEEKIVFTPLVKPAPSSGSLNRGENENPAGGTDDGSGPEAISDPVDIQEKKGFEKGYEQGFAEGLDQGRKKGHEKGFEQGRKEGYEKGFEQGNKEGHEQGFAKGVEQGENQAKQQADQIISSLEETLKTADQTLDFLVDNYEDKIISLIMQIAEKAVLAKLEIDDEIVKNMILEALKHLVDPEEIVLSVSVEDYDYIEMVKDEFFEKINSLTNVSIRSDSSVKRGACRIETACAHISADPNERLEAIFNAMKTAGKK